MPRPSPVTAEQETSLIKEYLAGTSRNLLAIRYDASRPFITDFLRRHGVAVRGLKEACPGFPLNHAAFDDAATSPEAAYWVGFLMADGCISFHAKQTPHVILVLSITDKDHVESLKRFVGAHQHKIYFIPAVRSGYKGGKDSIRLDLVSAQLVAALATYGVVPRKSLTAKVLILENNRHFWRGYVDGNGSLGISKRGNYKPRPVLQLCGSESIISQFANFAVSVTGTTMRPHRDHTVWGAALSCSHAIKMIRHLYDDCSVALPRKLAKARQLAW